MSVLTTEQIILVGCFALAYRLTPFAYQALQPRRSQPTPRDKARTPRSQIQTPPPAYRRTPPKRHVIMPRTSPLLRIIVVKLREQVLQGTESHMTSSMASTPSPATQAPVTEQEPGPAAALGELEEEVARPTTTGPQTPAWSQGVRYQPKAPRYNPTTVSTTTRTGSPGQAHEQQQERAFLETMKDIGYRLVSPNVPAARIPLHSDNVPCHDYHENIVAEDPFVLRVPGAIDTPLPLNGPGPDEGTRTSSDPCFLFTVQAPADRETSLPE